MPKKLKKCIKKVRKKKGSRSAYAICSKSLFKSTSSDYGHRHKWIPGRIYTTLNNKHKHKVNTLRMLALPAGIAKHTHKLLKRKVI